MRPERSLKVDHRVNHRILNLGPAVLIPVATHLEGPADPASPSPFFGIPTELLVGRLLDILLSL